jgi:hypothetical protein
MSKRLTESGNCHEGIQGSGESAQREGQNEGNQEMTAEGRTSVELMFEDEMKDG